MDYCKGRLSRLRLNGDINNDIYDIGEETMKISICLKRNRGKKIIKKNEGHELLKAEFAHILELEKNGKLKKLSVKYREVK